MPPSRCVLFHLVEMNAFIFFFLYQITHLERCRLQSREFTQAACETTALCYIFQVGKNFPEAFFSPHFFYFGLDDEALTERSKVRERMMPTAPSEHFIMKR